MKIGYARVSTKDQNLDRQIDALEKYGCEKIFTEHASGAKASRPELDAMLAMLRKDDVVVVVKLDRIGRSTKHIIELSEKFDAMGVNFVSLGDKIDTTSATGRFFFRVMAAAAELERDLIVERTKEGLASARARGRCGGRPKADSKKLAMAMKMYESKTFSVSEIRAATGISKSTLYRYLSENHK